jgi:hypothetical protein
MRKRLLALIIGVGLGLSSCFVPSFDGIVEINGETERVADRYTFDMDCLSPLSRRITVKRENGESIIFVDNDCERRPGLDYVEYRNPSDNMVKSFGTYLACYGKSGMNGMEIPPEVVQNYKEYLTLINKFEN